MSENDKAICEIALGLLQDVESILASLSPEGELELNQAFGSQFAEDIERMAAQLNIFTD